MVWLLPFLLQAAALMPMPPQSKSETAAMRAARSLALSTAAAPAEWLTRAEKTRFEETGTYGEAVEFYRKLEKASPYARLASLGQTSEGRTLYVLIASKDGAFTPQAARRLTKPVVLLQNGIHAGENGGKDAAMMLLRDVLVTRRLQGLLDKLIILSIPVFNADGHEHRSAWNRINENGPREMGFRVTAQRLNLNRDYVKADTPEMWAWLRMYTGWLPELLIDNHVTDGSDNQYDVTLATHTEQDIAPSMGEWVKRHYLPALMTRLEEMGHVPGYYIEGRAAAGQALAVMTASPRYSTGYAAAQNRAALLVETHSPKSFRTRVWAHYDIMRATLELAAARAAELRAAALESDRMQEAVEAGDRVFFEGKPGINGETYRLRGLKSVAVPSPVTGGMITQYTAEPSERVTTLVRELEAKVVLQAPHGYIVPRAWTDVIGLLLRHGVKMNRLKEALDGEFDTYRFEDVRFASTPFEGRMRINSFSLKPARVKMSIPAGSMFVPVAQRAGKLAMHILEPDAPDSAVRWGFFLSVFEQKEYFSDYVFEPFARQMIEQDVKLREEFETKIAAEPEFARNGRARLFWLYQRSPYYEPGKDVYPVVRVGRNSDADSTGGKTTQAGHPE